MRTVDLPCLIPIVGVENEAADLDTLAGRGIGLGARVHKGRVRDTPGPAVRLTVEALDEKHLLGCQPPLVVPAVRGRVPHRERLALAVGIN